jgi:hypothetical protein
MLPGGSGICFLNVLHALNAFETMAEADSFRKPEFALELREVGNSRQHC